MPHNSKNMDIFSLTFCQKCSLILLFSKRKRWCKVASSIMVAAGPQEREANSQWKASGPLQKLTHSSWLLAGGKINSLKKTGRVIVTLGCGDQLRSPTLLMSFSLDDFYAISHNASKTVKSPLWSLNSSTPPEGSHHGRPYWHLFSHLLSLPLIQLRNSNTFIALRRNEEMNSKVFPQSQGCIHTLNPGFSNPKFSFKF